MKITTETGSVYDIEDGFCTKYNAEGQRVDAFKVWAIKSVPEVPITWEELHDLPVTSPVVGQHLYVSGKDLWWLSTTIVSVE